MKEMYTIKMVGSKEVLGVYSTQENATETAVQLHNLTGKDFIIKRGMIHESVTLDDKIDEDEDIFED